MSSIDLQQDSVVFEDMANEQTLQRYFRDGQEAEAVLENRIFKAQARALEKEYSAAFKGDDLDAALEARRKAQVFEDFLTKLAIIHKRGIQAGKDLENLKQRRHQGLSLVVNDMQGIV